MFLKVQGFFYFLFLGQHREFAKPQIKNLRKRKYGLLFAMKIFSGHIWWPHATENTAGNTSQTVTTLRPGRN
jgi:hypothetical protein